METDRRAGQVAERLADGRLPKRRSATMWATFGTGKPCDGCGEPIRATEVEHEVEFEGGGLLRFHAACLTLWERLASDSNSD